MRNQGVFNFDSITEVLNVLNKINNIKSVNLTHYMGKTGSVDDKEVARRKKIIHTENSVKSFSESFDTLQKTRQIRHVDGSQHQLDKTVTTGNNQKISIQNEIDHMSVNTKNLPKNNFTSHSSSIKFKNIKRQPRVTNKSSGSYIHNVQFIGDRLLDTSHKSSLYT